MHEKHPKQNLSDEEHNAYLTYISKIHKLNDKDSKKLLSIQDSNGNDIYFCKGDYIYEGIERYIRTVNVPLYYIHELIQFVETPEKIDSLVHEYNTQNSTSLRDATSLLLLFPSDSKPLHKSFISIILEKRPSLTEFTTSVKLIEKDISKEDEQQIYKTYRETLSNEKSDDNAKIKIPITDIIGKEKEIMACLSTAIQHNLKASAKLQEANAKLIKVNEQYARRHINL